MVHVLGQVLPRPRDPLHARLTAKLTLDTHFLGHTRDLRCKRAELVDHGVDGPPHAHQITLDRTAGDIVWDGLGKITGGYRADDARYLENGVNEVIDRPVLGLYHSRPGPLHTLERGPLGNAALTTDEVGNAAEFLGQTLVMAGEGVDEVGDLLRAPGAAQSQAYGKIAFI